MQECGVGVRYRMPFPCLTSLPPSQPAGLHGRLMDRFRSWGNISNYTSREKLKRSWLFYFLRTIHSLGEKGSLSLLDEYFRTRGAYSLCPLRLWGVCESRLLKECLDSVTNLACSRKHSLSRVLYCAAFESPRFCLCSSLAYGVFLVVILMAIWQWTNKWELVWDYQPLWVTSSLFPSPKASSATILVASTHQSPLFHSRNVILLKKAAEKIAFIAELKPFFPSNFETQITISQQQNFSYTQNS